MNSSQLERTGTPHGEHGVETGKSGERMKKLSEVIPSLSTRSSNETESGQDCSRANKVWLQLAQLFGNGFYREHGDKPSNLWLQAVAKLQDYEIARGLANLANDNLQFPANLSQFVSASRRLPPVRYLGVKYIEDKRETGTMSRQEWIEKNSK